MNPTIENHDSPEDRKSSIGHDKPSLVGTDNPDDFEYEGKFRNQASTSIGETKLGDRAYVKVDNPDDLE